MAIEFSAPWGLQAISSRDPLDSHDPNALNYTYRYDSKAGEGVDETQWADYQPLRKDDIEKKPKEKKQKEKEKDSHDAKVKKVSIDEVFSV